MSLQILSPNLPNPSEPLKRARERLDKVAEQERIGWKAVQLLGQEMFGKTKGFSLSECNVLMKEIRKRKG